MVIAQALNARGVLPPRATQVGRAAWAKSAVHVIIHNPVYQGDLVWGRARYREVGKKRGKRALPESDRVVARDAVPAIVPRVLWTAAQHQHERDGRRFGMGRPWHRPYLLRGVIVCANCGRHFQAQKQYRGRVPAYYLCGGYVASGRALWAASRIPTTYIDDAVLDGIQERLDRLVDPCELRRRLAALLPDDKGGERMADTLASQLQATSVKIDRLVAAVAAGTEEMPTLRSMIVALEQERARLLGELNAVRARGGAANDREAIITGLVTSIGQVGDILNSGDPEERRALVRNFLAEVRVEQQAGRIVLRWYRIPRDSWVKLVAVGGIEPPTRGL